MGNQCRIQNITNLSCIYLLLTEETLHYYTLKFSLTCRFFSMLLKSISAEYTIMTSGSVLNS